LSAAVGAAGNGNDLIVEASRSGKSLRLRLARSAQAQVGAECSGEDGRGVLGQLVQLDLERQGNSVLDGLCVRGLAQLDDLGLEGSDAPPQTGDLEGQDLIRSAADVTKQGACHISTFREPARPALVWTWCTQVQLYGQ
jgi:hypothetical protein